MTARAPHPHPQQRQAPHRRVPYLGPPDLRTSDLRGVIVRAWLTGCLIVAALGATAALLGYDSLGDLLTEAWP